MGKFYLAFAWDRIVNLHVCICKNKICIWSDPGVNSIQWVVPICKYTLVCICVRMRHLLTPCKICTPEHIYIIFCVYFWRIRLGLGLGLNIGKYVSAFWTTHVYHYVILLFGSIESKLNGLSWIQLQCIFVLFSSLNLICKICKIPEVVEFLRFYNDIINIVFGI